MFFVWMSDILSPQSSRVGLFWGRVTFPSCMLWWTWGSSAIGARKSQIIHDWEWWKPYHLLMVMTGRWTSDCFSHHIKWIIPFVGKLQVAVAFEVHRYELCVLCHRLAVCKSGDTISNRQAKPQRLLVQSVLDVSLCGAICNHSPEQPCGSGGKTGWFPICCAQVQGQTRMIPIFIYIYPFVYIKTSSRQMFLVKVSERDLLSWDP